MEDFYTVRQVQEILKVDRVTIYRMLNDGRLRGIKIGQQWRFPRSEIEHMLNRETAEPVPADASAPAAADAGFPTHCIQTIQDLFAEISQMNAVVVDMNGDPMTVYSHPSKFCSLILSSLTGREACRACWREAVRLHAEQTHFTCHAGLTLMTIPLLDRGVQIGALVMGEFYWQPPDRYEEAERVQKLANLHHIDRQALQDAIFDIQVIPAEKHLQVETWPRHTVNAMHSILNERSGFIQRLQKIADLTQVS
jgi:excisionase family DNA binding protein